MSINWVMLSPTSNSNAPPFTPLPNESSLFVSSPRISLALSTPAHFPGKQQTPFSLSSPSDRLYLTNPRLIYIPDKPTSASVQGGQFQSFAAPILNLHDSHVAAPWFGPNVWTALLQPTQGGGIPTPPGGVVEIKFTFKEGGAFDFQSQYERVRERLQQAVEAARMDGDGSATRGAGGGVDVSNVNLEDLPAYREESDGPLLNPSAPVAQRQTNGTGSGASPRPMPDEPPPGYEETQRDALQERLDDGRR